MNRVEDGIQISIVNYLRATLPHGWLVMAVSNKPRSKISGAQEKRMGALAGWPDVAVYGLKPGEAHEYEPVTYFLEVKAPKGRLQENQHMVHARLRDLGFEVAVVRSIDDVKAFIKTFGLPSRDAALNDNSDPWSKLGDLAQEILRSAKGNA